MSSFNELFNGDMQRYGKNGPCKWTRKYLYFLRKSATCKNKIMGYYYHYAYRKISEKHGIEIPYGTAIGKGFYIGHTYNITINGEAKLGNNINIHKGVTIGQENRGKRKGAPTIGNEVWIGVNATIVGKINIGDDVLIAPNSYINCDVPSHSIAVGNPCKIIQNDHATECYINNPS